MKNGGTDIPRNRSERQTVADKHGAMLLHRQFYPATAPAAFYQQPWCAHNQSCTSACLECKDGFIA